MNKEIKQLLQLLTVTWDGDLISKTCVTHLAKMGLASRMGGYAMISWKGFRYLRDLKLIPEQKVEL